MRIVCAWCEKEMGVKEPIEDENVSHGICEECYKKNSERLIKSVEERKKEGFTG